MADASLLRRAAELAESGQRFVMATLIDRVGSAPADVGAKMIVLGDQLDCGTVGGGRIEAKAIDTAAAMLAGDQPTQLVDWSLKADVGMTCGGRVQLMFEVIGGTAWPIVIFGAGHVTQALARLLVTLPCQVTCIDPRPEWLEKLPAGTRAVETQNPPAEVANLPGEAFVLCMTRGHRSDLPVLAAILQRDAEFPYLGVIGSHAKAAVLRKELLAAGVPADRLRFHCPVGLPIGSNNPNEIAVSIAAQLLEQRRC